MHDKTPAGIQGEYQSSVLASCMLTRHLWHSADYCIFKETDGTMECFVRCCKDAWTALSCSDDEEEPPLCTSANSGVTLQSLLTLPGRQDPRRPGEVDNVGLNFPLVSLIYHIRHTRALSS